MHRLLGVIRVRSSYKVAKASNSSKNMKILAIEVMGFAPDSSSNVMFVCRNVRVPCCAVSAPSGCFFVVINNALLCFLLHLFPVVTSRSSINCECSLFNLPHIWFNLPVKFRWCCFCLSNATRALVYSFTGGA